MGLKKYIVTTTINAPTLATQKFSRMEGWTLIVVGDTKTPHLNYEELAQLVRSFHFCIFQILSPNHCQFSLIF